MNIIHWRPWTDGQVHRFGVMTEAQRDAAVNNFSAAAYMGPRGKELHVYDVTDRAGEPLHVDVFADGGTAFAWLEESHV